MADVIFHMIFGAGILIWLAVVLALIWFTRVGVIHGIQAWEMSGRIVNESKTPRPRLRWWWHMYWHGPVASITTADDNHTIYWPGKEPSGWYSLTEAGREKLG